MWCLSQKSLEVRLKSIWLESMGTMKSVRRLDLLTRRMSQLKQEVGEIRKGEDDVKLSNLLVYTEMEVKPTSPSGKSCARL
ncbi:unnamed protein product [Linum trigynum]|uniref:Uncharacterized protein n=1 Tax=Linum trigynum TaxID=586398 RepID=A0AAV2EUF4_9ROSI